MAAAIETISVEIDKDEKERFLAACNEIGISPDSAIRRFVAAFNRCGGFPFESSDPEGLSEAALAAMDDAEHGRNLLGPFYSVEELMKALEEEQPMPELAYVIRSSP